MNKKVKGILIDLGLLLIWAFCLMMFLYFGFGTIYKTRIVAVLLLLLNIPIIWGTIIMSIIEKKTIGHRIMSKKHVKNLRSSHFEKNPIIERK